VVAPAVPAVVPVALFIIAAFPFRLQ